MLVWGVGLGGAPRSPKTCLHTGGVLFACKYIHGINYILMSTIKQSNWIVHVKKPIKNFEFYTVCTMVYEGKHTLGLGLSSTEKNRELISVFELDHGSVAVTWLLCTHPAWSNAWRQTHNVRCRQYLRGYCQIHKFNNGPLLRSRCHGFEGDSIEFVIWQYPLCYPSSNTIYNVLTSSRRGTSLDHDTASDKMSCPGLSHRGLCYQRKWCYPQHMNCFVVLMLQLL